MKFEENITQAYQDKALEDVRSEHGKYFEALEQHPRLLVGREVPAIGKEGTEVLRDANDAREWQDAVKSILVQEVRSRAGKALEENKTFLETIHSSIELFQNNADLIPGTKDFDVDLANRFAEMAKPYELRVEGKLQGYSIPVQPIIDQLRTQVAAARAAKPTEPAKVTKTKAPAKPVDPPQPGIPAKAGNGDAAEDFSSLFGTIGLPNLRI